MNIKTILALTIAFFCLAWIVDYSLGGKALLALSVAVFTLPIITLEVIRRVKVNP